MSEIGDSDNPSAVLRREHQIILRVIGVLRRLVKRSTGGAGFEDAVLGRCVQFFRLFADACHHAKEEDLLFPVLEERGIPREGGPIGVMLYEHRLARQYTAAMAEALAARKEGDGQAMARFHEAAGQYIELLTSHIDKEDHCLFPMGDRVMTEQDTKSLCGKFCDAGCRSFDGKRREELERIADELEAEWPAGSAGR